MDILIYDFSTHSLNYEKRSDINSYSLTIGFLELVFDFDSDLLIGVQGFLPLVHAKRCDILLPKSSKGIFKSPKKNITKGQLYDYYSSTGNYKHNAHTIYTRFDENMGVIEIDIKPPSPNTSSIRINKNIICSIDTEGDLQVLYIKPDQFIK